MGRIRKRWTRPIGPPAASRFLHSIYVTPGPGGAVTVAGRTNNVLAPFFGTAKQGLRRRVGRSHLGRDLEDQPTQVALTANLRHPDYERILGGTLEQLPQVFAQLDGQACAGPSRLERKKRNAELRRRSRAWDRDARR